MHMAKKKGKIDPAAATLFEVVEPQPIAAMPATNAYPKNLYIFAQQELTGLNEVFGYRGYQQFRTKSFSQLNALIKFFEKTKYPYCVNVPYYTDELAAKARELYPNCIFYCINTRDEMAKHDQLCKRIASDEPIDDALKAELSNTYKQLLMKWFN